MDSFPNILILLIGGLVAGVIDSIAGGGGLITVPMISLLKGPGSLAIGTNKVAAVAAAGFALAVYLRNGHVKIKGNRRFALLIGVGALVGSSLSPFIPPAVYRWILLAICPVILVVVYRKDLWVQAELGAHVAPAAANRWLFWSLGFLCGFYDGIAGPGGGTLMFLALLLIARIPLLAAMATAKVANLTSASVALVSFAISGNVLWSTGAWAAVGISVGAIGGASLVQSKASTHGAAKIARIALLVLVTLLLLRLFSL